jgi:hypothetical protein
MILTIGSNLAAALRQLRSTTSEITIWADAVCINQGDNDEKSCQLPLMARIYSQARAVVSWLGKGGLVDAWAMDVVGPFAREWNCWNDHGKKSLTDWERKHGSAMMLSLARNQYFSRAWIVQEIGMSGTRAVVRLGSRVVSWDDFVKAWAVAVTVSAGAAAPVSANRINMIDWARGADASAVYERPTPRAELLTVLWRYRPLDAMDPHDKVFAFLNLAQDDPVIRDSHLTPRYDEEVATTYHNVAKAILRVSGRLDILRVPKGLDFPTKLGRPLPSWVPDWSRCDETLMVTPFSPTDDTGLEYSMQQQFQISEDGRELTVHGTICSVEVRSVGDLFRRTVSSETDFGRERKEAGVLLQWEKMAGAHAAGISSQYSPDRPVSLGLEQGETIGDAYRRTLLFGREYLLQDGTCREDFEAWYRKLDPNRNPLPWGWGLLRFSPLAGAAKILQSVSAAAAASSSAGQGGLSSGSQQCGKSERFQNELALVAVGRRFFITSDHRFGMGPAGLQTGDTIALVKGVSVPLVLRKALENSNESLCKWRLVGDCYVHSEKVMTKDPSKIGDKTGITII